MKILISRRSAFATIAFLVMAGITNHVLAQEDPAISPETEQRLENMAERDDVEENKDDTYLQELQYYKAHPLNINQADKDDLKELQMLSGLQIDRMLQYRRLLGALVSIYELQAVPGWDPATIEKLRPFIIVEKKESLYAGLKERLTSGKTTLLTRSSETPEKAKGYLATGDSASHYEGSRNRLYVRYKYAFKDLLQYGILGDKDAGESFLSRSQSYGFDFYSFHFFLRKAGIIKALALGDFTISMGQGLIQWQGLSTGIGADALNVKKQSAVLKPYNSAGEYNFERGGGITLAKNNWEGTVFFSERKLDGTMQTDTSGDQAISSINTSGYHRTLTELSRKGNIKEDGAGACLKYTGPLWHCAFNATAYHFSRPVIKRNLPYNLYAMQDKTFFNTSMDYSCTLKNIHLFGEAAIDQNGNPAILSGLLLSADQRVDASLVYRNLNKAYHALYGNAFTQNSTPGNESGLYSSINIRFSPLWSIACYADIFRFPWLKYRIDAPSYGHEYMIKLTCKPNKNASFYIRYRYKMSGIDNPEQHTGIPATTPIPLTNLRIHLETIFSPFLSMRNRCELSEYDSKGAAKEQGFLLYTELLIKSPKGGWTGNARIAKFNTDGYNSRIYSYENDVPYASSVSPVYAKGTRYFLNISKKIMLSKKADSSLHIALRWLQTIYNQRVMSSGLDEIKGNKKSELKLQIIFT